MKLNKTAVAVLVIFGVLATWGTFRVVQLKHQSANNGNGVGQPNTQTAQQTQPGVNPGQTQNNLGTGGSTATSSNTTVAGTTPSGTETGNGGATGSVTGHGVALNAGVGAGGTGKVLPGAPQTGVKSTTEMSKADLALQQPAGACEMITFHHKKLSTHASDDECSHHRNLVKLGHDDVNASTVCIRVNGTPVRHEAVQGKTDEFIIGPVAGPHDTITARFCTGKIQCSETCKYPAKDPVKHDEFLDAIGGTDATDDTKVAHWEAGDAAKTAEVNQAVDGEIKKELQNQDEAAKKVAQSKMEVFKDWINESEQPSCGSVATTSKHKERTPAAVSASR